MLMLKCKGSTLMLVFFNFLSLLFVFQKPLPEHLMNGNKRKKQENWELNRSKRKKIYMLSQKNKR